MADVRIVSDTPCPCCSTAEPACEVQCLSVQSSGCAKEAAFDCAPITYPINGTGCTTLQYFIPCPCEEPPAHLVVTSQARLRLTGLTPGRNYTATLIFQKQLTFPLEEQFVTWNFTADAAEEFTPYVAVPNPAAEDLPGWGVSGCTIVGAACTFECKRSGTAFVCEPGEPRVCVVYPVVDDLLCAAEYHAPDPTGCQSDPPVECPTEVTTLLISWRAHGTGLEVGANYRVSATFEAQDGTTTVLSFTFTATASSETTAWQAGPTPDAARWFWTFKHDTGCSISKV